MATPSRKVFLTGGTGTIGSRILSQLVAEGFEVTALVRSDAGAAAVEAQGAVPFRGNVTVPGPVVKEAVKADAVMHLAMDPDMTRFNEAVEENLTLCRALVAGMKGTHKPLIATSGIALFAPTHTAADDSSQRNPDFPSARYQAEDVILQGVQEGVRSMLIRLPTHVWGPGGKTHGTSQFTQWQAAGVKQRGEPCYVGAVRDYMAGDNRISVCHVDDAAALYILAMKHGEAGDIFTCSGQDDITGKSLAEAIGKGLGMAKPPVSISNEEGMQVFGPFLGYFYPLPCYGDASKVRKKLGWQPKHVDDYHSGVAAAGAAGKLGVTS